MRKKFGAAALDIVFGLVVGYLFLDKITGWALNNAFLQSRFSEHDSRVYRVSMVSGAL